MQMISGSSGQQAELVVQAAAQMQRCMATHDSYKRSVQKCSEIAYTGLCTEGDQRFAACTSSGMQGLEA